MAADGWSANDPQPVVFVPVWVFPVSAVLCLTLRSRIPYVQPRHVGATKQHHDEIIHRGVSEASFTY